MKVELRLTLTPAEAETLQRVFREGYITMRDDVQILEGRVAAEGKATQGPHLDALKKKTSNLRLDLAQVEILANTMFPNLLRELKTE